MESRNYTSEEAELVGPLFRQHPDAVVYSGDVPVIQWAVEWLEQHAGPAPAHTDALSRAHLVAEHWYDSQIRFADVPPGPPPQCPSPGDFAIAAAYLGYSLRQVRGHWQADLYIDYVEPVPSASCDNPESGVSWF